MIVAALIQELRRSLPLFFRLGDTAYKKRTQSGGSIGEHFRHNLNFVEAVLIGSETGSIDYKRRYRDPLVETSRIYAASRSEAVIARLERFSPAKLMSDVLVSSEVDPHIRFRSMIAREIEFVHSHTVHHHALIAERLEEMGISVEMEFGVASSTLEYWAQKAA